MTAYKFPIPAEKTVAKKMIVFFVAFLNVVAFAYGFLYSKADHSILGVGFAVSVIGLLILAIKQFTRFFQQFKIEISFIICALAWLISSNFLPGLLLAGFAIFSLRSSKNFFISVNADGILLPGFPQKKIYWPEIDFVKLKDGILSIEMKNNHLYQFSLQPTIANKIDELKFNSFCATMPAKQAETSSSANT